MQNTQKAVNNVDGVTRKDKHFQAQFSRIYNGFFQPKTMKELSIITGIDRANICRYVRTMRKAGTIAVVRKRYCSITKHLAGVYTTDPKLIPAKQPTLFDGIGGAAL